MSIETVIAAWNTKVLQHETIQAITTKTYTYPILVSSGKEAQKLYYEKQVNFITLITNITTKLNLNNRLEKTYYVDVSIYRENEPTGANYTAMMTTLEAIDALVISELGPRWNSTVDYYQPGELPTVQQILIDEKSVWQLIARYTGYKYNS